MSSHRILFRPAGVPAASDLRQALRLLQRPRFNLLTSAGEEREALRQFAHTYGRSIAALHLEARGQFQTADAAWAAGDDLARTLLEGDSINTDDQSGFLRRFKTAFFAGYQAYQHEVATARRQAQPQGLQPALFGRDLP